MTLEQIDATGLIREAYRIEGITAAECRSIFVDWALKAPVAIPSAVAIARLLDVYGADNPDHPMTAVLREGLNPPTPPKRRGGRKARVN